MSKLKSVGERFIVHVEPRETEKTTAGGIILNTSDKSDPLRIGTVVDVPLKHHDGNLRKHDQVGFYVGHSQEIPEAPNYFVVEYKDILYAIEDSE